jgi:crotonobetainyl-CoA:carnitine CoA-transferase CaiB-like acyl-CoA transferase
MSEPSLPLAGLVAVEIGHSVAGPFAGMILAELGAEVVKIENPENGDDARSWGPPFVEASSALFKALNRNKKSAALDLKAEADHADLLAFVRERADIVLQNMRPGTVDRLGLGAEALRRDKPSLIYCNMGAYGAVGPLSRHPGYDPLMQAFGGIMSVTGEEGRDPVRVGPSLVDQGTGMWAVIGILAALHRRQETGEGCVVDTSLFETAVTWVAPHVANYLASGAMPRRLGTENPGIAPYKAYSASDGWLIIAAGNNALFRRAAEVLGHPEWIEDPAFATNADRVTNRERLNALIADIVAGMSRAHWLAALEAAGVPCAPMQTIGELVAHEQLIATGILQPPPEGQLPLLGLPVQMDGVRPAYRRVAPALGADTGIVRRAATETTP